jgi:hypothetical protein
MPFVAITLITLLREAYEGAVAKIAQLAARLLLKQDQCRAVYQCAHLFWPPAASGQA